MSVAPETAQPDTGSEEPMPDPVAPTGLDAVNEPAPEPEQPSEEREAPPPAADEPAAEDDAEPESAEEAAELAEEPEVPARRSWLDRLLGR